MAQRLVEFLRRGSRWVTGAALFALAPKCLLCLAAYAGLGAALGLTSPEICGASGDDAGVWSSAVSYVAVAAFCVGAGRSSLSSLSARVRLTPRGKFDRPR